MPVMIDAFLRIGHAAGQRRRTCLSTSCSIGLEVNEERCRELIDQSLMMVTSLAPVVGYEKSAALAKDAFKSGKTIRQLCLQENVLAEAELDKLLDPMSMTEPSA